MPNPFDNLRRMTFAAATTAFGEVATWAPSTGGLAVSAPILFKDPSSDMSLAFVDFSHIKPVCEFPADAFPGLKDAVDERLRERLSIGGVFYFVTLVEAIHDGATYKATLVRDDSV